VTSLSCRRFLIATRFTVAMSAIELATAVATGDAAGVRSVLEKAADRKQLLEARIGLHGATLLHMAASHGHAEVVSELINFGANPNSLDSSRNAPISYILADNPHADATKEALVSKGAVEELDYFHYNQPQPSEDEEVGYIDRQFLTRVFAAFLTPFVVLILYNGLWFCAVFVTVTSLFYFVAVSFFASELTVKPPWYQPSGKATTLTMERLPSEWRNVVHNPKKNFGYVYEDVEFSSRGGYTLRGWYVPGDQSCAKKTALVFLHGGARDRRSWLRHLPIFYKSGYTCLLFDLREHGISDGAHRGLSFGISERYDGVAAARYMKEVRGFGKVALLGTSMGASSSIMAAAIDTEYIDLVIAENPLLTCAHLQKQHVNNLISGYFKHSVWGRFVYATFLRMCSIWLNIKVGNKPTKRCQAMHIIHKVSPRPILLMHGTYDSVIPHEHSQALFERAKEPKELWVVPGAFHCGIYDAFPKEFEARVLGFLRKHGA
jgi:pimeloyl-ACP methyl ester carboxylesterase